MSKIKKPDLFIEAQKLAEKEVERHVEKLKKQGTDVNYLTQRHVITDIVASIAFSHIEELYREIETLKKSS